jgi:hypothetical protein
MANGHDPGKPPPTPGSGAGAAPGTGPKTGTVPKTGTGTGTGGVTPLDSHKPPQKAMAVLGSGMHH